ncbi:MAG: hypothetical protein EP330_05020 [Deltaproteobacteria bacterium]|nr:MAG: hypothetical protein EP330_05020 [Deltaproteobacteria bacterium]
MITLILATQALAADLVVGPNETYTTLSEAADAAASGDRILIMPGDYEDSLVTLDKTLTFEALGLVRWLGDGSGPNIATYNQDERFDTAIIRVVGLQLEANAGHQILSGSANFEIEDCDLFGGSTTGLLAGGQVGTETTVFARNSTFTGPTFAGIGGLIYSPSGTVVIDSQFTDGRAGKDGGAIAAGRGGLWVEGSHFERNQATDGGAVAGAGAYVYDSTFVDNHAANGGGHVSDATIIARSQFGSGSADSGVAVNSQFLRLVIDSEFTDNADIVATATNPQLQFIRNTHCVSSAIAIDVSAAAENLVGVFNNQANVDGLLFRMQGTGRLAIRHNYVTAPVGPVIFKGKNINTAIEANVFDAQPVFDTMAGDFMEGGRQNWYERGAPISTGLSLIEANYNRLGEASGLTGDPCIAAVSYVSRPQAVVVDAVPMYLQGFAEWDWPAIDWDDSYADAGPYGGLFADPALYVDNDGDGWVAALDCNDANPNIAPLHPEDCSDPADNDCDPATSADGFGGQGISYYDDRDGDGFGDAVGAADFTCTPLAGWVANRLDCDDNAPQVYPGHADVCDAVDNDCDGEQNSVPSDWYDDGDGDGVGKSFAYSSCVTQTTALQGGDCDDTVPGGAQGYGMVGYWDWDADGAVDDRYPNDVLLPSCTPAPADCNDDDNTTVPGATDTCDGVDSDCDGNIDEDATTSATGFIDADGDGYGDVAYSGCDGRTDVVPDGGDCDDSNPAIHPNRVDVCNGFDDDCDGTADNGIVPHWWVDLDGDGAYVDSNVDDCTPPHASAIDTAPSVLDCDDTEPTTTPGGTELCGDDVDNDCDGVTDEQSGGVPWWLDADSDGYAVELPVYFCPGETPAGGYSPSSTDPWDCDDSDGTVYPGSTEACDGVDNDCDDSIDEESGDPAFADIDGDGFGGVPLGTYCTAPNGSVAEGGDCDDNDPNIGLGAAWYRDADGDGFGNAVVYACEDPGTGFVQVDGDCVDSDALAFPGADEDCNSRDDDCDGATDEGLPTQSYYGDADGDGWGGALIQACGPGAAVSGLSGDCDDNDPTVFPSALDLCEDGIDANCDGTDPICNVQDLDGDGFCEGGCENPGDCNDGDASVSPWAVEDCNGEDDDCDGLIDDGLTSDHDGDGFTEVGSCEGSADDCNDWIDTIFVGATEACNGLDDDCNDAIDEGLLTDADGDGFPAASSCLTFAPFDCDDTDASVYPGATETNNGTDDDCDGQTDEPASGDDADGDGYCEGPTCDDAGVLPGDCDDTDPSVNPGPGAIDIDDGIDNDCDGTVDDGPSRDTDRDRDGYTVSQGDCNDLNPHIHPGAVEQCNGLDDDCDGLVALTEFDIDQDGLRACEGDCNDYDARVRPGIAEDCADELDNNCDGLVNEDADADRDGFTTCMGDCRDDLPEINPAAPEEACNEVDDNCDGVIDEGLDRDGDGWIACLVVLEDGCIPDQPLCDCDDTNAYVAPYLPEICGDGLDNNCDGAVDNDEDVDGDGWTTCEGDCRDNDPFFSPGAAELCDDLDNDCDFRTDEGFDVDGDGWRTCAGDCDDTSAVTYPLAEELCDTLDNDCNGVVDDEWPDRDLDGFTECDPTPDCAEGDATVSPAQVESCDNGVDDDCDGATDWQDADCDATSYPAYCGCQTGSSGPGPWLLAPLLAGLVRRRRRVASRLELPDVSI